MDEKNNNSTEVIHPDVRKQIEKLILDKGIAYYTLKIESGTTKGDNYLGVIAKAKIVGLDKNGENVTLNWIVKCAPSIDSFRKLMKIDRLYEREMYVYEKLFPTYKEFQRNKLMLNPFDQVPNFVACFAEPTKETIIMEDLKSVGYVMKDRKLPLDLYHVRLAMKAYAKFHAISYAIKDQKPEDFKRIAENAGYLFEDNVELIDLFKKQSAYFDIILDSFDPNKDEKIIKKLRKYFERIHAIGNETMKVALDSPYTVIIHGDSWVNNMLFLYDNTDYPEIPSKICLLDWQMAHIVSPVFDLAYFLFTCTDKSLRDSHYHELIKLYYYTMCSDLVEMGSDPEKCIPFEDFHKELKRCSVVGVNISLILLNMMMSDVEEIPDYQSNNGQVDQLFVHKTKNQDAYVQRVRGIVVNAYEYGYFDFIDD